MSTDTPNLATATSTAIEQVDVRGPRCAAWVTTAVLLIALIVSAVSTTAAAAILAAQAVVFAYGRVFATVVAPRLGPVTEREPVAPLKFAQLVGLVFAVAGVAGFAFGAPLLGVIATAFALAAAFLNAAFGICLGCMLYPMVVRLRHTPAA